MRTLLYRALLAVALVSCSFDRDEHPQACERDADCPSNGECYENFCVVREPAATDCSETSRIESCYDGTQPATMGVGICKAGQRICVDGNYSECLGQTLPEDEVCNGKDDDCDGNVDNVPPASTCDTSLDGACQEGALLCRNGVELCSPRHEIETESCNAIDDDCDGTKDEGVSAMCYPSDTEGCMRDAQGAWHCTGLCGTGMSACEGMTEAMTCSGAVTPIGEACTDNSELAQDEDCDGTIDEGCTCGNDDTRDCYAGPVGTRDLGICRAGTQQCSNTAWGPCTMQVLPDRETCDNPGRDDDCNDVEDDIAGLGSSCIAEDERGLCRNGTIDCRDEPEPECVPGAATKERCDAIDQDCDGEPRNGFDLNSDTTCGACDVECSQDETCCGGTCIDVASLEEDVDNCGACGTACGMGQYCCQGDCLSATPTTMAACACTDDCGDRSCCGTNCRDLENDKGNCGACGRKCGRDEQCVDGMCSR